MISDISYTNSFIGTQLNGSEHYNGIPIIQFLPTFKLFQVFLFNTNNSIQHNTVKWSPALKIQNQRQFNVQTVLFD